DVDVRDARIAPPLGSDSGPARDLECLEALRGRPRCDLFERELRERRGEQAELHAGTPTHCRSRALVVTASPRTLARWPSANVGKSGSWGIEPAATAAYTA